MASSSSSSRHVKKHQVFLSFKGEDTRKGFTSYLLKDLEDKGISVFFDEKIIEKGEQLSPAILTGIQNSQIAIIILSKHYASSKSCLMELSEIMDQLSEGQLDVVPIFYHVNPSDVRYRRGSFKKSFDKHHSINWKSSGWKNFFVGSGVDCLWRRGTSVSPSDLSHQSKSPVDTVERWEKAFAEVGVLKGWHIYGGNSDRSEPDYITDIVGDVINKLSSKFISDHNEEFVGLSDKKKAVMNLINEETTRAVLICGMGGIGKTTLAQATYDDISQKFSSNHFFLNVHQLLERQGMELLRNDLLSMLLKQKIRIDTPHIPTFIQQRLRNQRVFGVLDDVNKTEQLEHLGVKHYGDGSKILITSRDQQVLKNVYKNGVAKIYIMPGLNDDESLQLFSRFAFDSPNQAPDFQYLACEFVRYCEGLPLALKVLGRHLLGKSRMEWKSAPEGLKECPNADISEVLRISFDGLNEVEKNIFLDIACFFIGEWRYYLTDLLSCCYKGALDGIRELHNKFLVGFNDVNVVIMHDLLRDMGRDIVRQESVDNPGKRSRLWDPKDVHQVFKYNMGTESIKGIIFEWDQTNLELPVSPTTFEKMIHLRFLKISWSLPKLYYKRYPKMLVFTSKDPPSLPNELRCLWWDNYPWKSLPSNFNPKNLYELRLCNGEMEYLWNGDQDVVNLRVLDVSNSRKLRKFPNLSGAIKLESLHCLGCESLEELPPLIHLTSLKYLNFGRNYGLKKFPEFIPPRIVFPFGNLELQNSNIEEVPDSIQHFTNLCFWDMQSSRVRRVSTNISKLKSLESLNFSYCRIENLPTSFCKLDALLYLQLSNCPNITEINFGASGLKSLKILDMSGCNSLKSLLNIPPCLLMLKAESCALLENVSFRENASFRDQAELDRFGLYCRLVFSDCFYLKQDSVDKIVTNAMLEIASLAKHVADTYLRLRSKILPPPRGNCYCCLPTNYEFSHKYFEHQSMSSSITLKIGPKRSGSIRFLVFTLCLVVYPDSEHYQEQDIQLICEGRFKDKSGNHCPFEARFYLSRCWSAHPNVDVVGQCKEHIHVFGDTDTYGLFPLPYGEHMTVLFNRDLVYEDMDYEEASFKFYFKQRNWYVDDDYNNNIAVKKCGVNLSYVEYNDVAEMRPDHKRKFNSESDDRRGMRV